MNHPDASELLAAARETLMKEVFPAVPDSLHYEIRMIASAMGIAAREAEQREAAIQEEMSLCSRLLPKTVVVGTTSQDEARRALARAIRAGQFDQEAQGSALYEALQQMVQSALRVSNPRLANTNAGEA
ncbi:DUF6285 domain-containing protein [Marinobacter daepoensis]|uniref:DUF6285 domain-containing protein n=1 Tax=Marinobacter daepoensis TaxID=262077 RepID=UPI0003F6369C|nr:DUF6285 domain-containing protein [Marinobacter daepoensis]